jgi:hypothetical protein
VQSVETWSYPQASEMIDPEVIHWLRREVKDNNYRRDVQAKDWVGNAVAARLKLDVRNDKVQIKGILKELFKNGTLTTRMGTDAKRMAREYVAPGVLPQTVADAMAGEE